MTVVEETEDEYWKEHLHWQIIGMRATCEKELKFHISPT